MRDYLSLGSTPCNEECAQLGSDGYREQARKECGAYKRQLQRIVDAKGATVPEDFTLAVKGFQHDYGTYFEVVAYFESEEGGGDRLRPRSEHPCRVGRGVPKGAWGMKRHLNVIVANTEAPDICGPCGGKCCKNIPGTTHPNEWGDDPEEIRSNIIAAIQSGYWSADCWDGDPRDEVPDGEYLGKAMYIRPRRRGADVWDMAWGWENKPCMFLGPEGCVREHDARPIECRGLVPDPTGPTNCTPSKEFNKRTNAIAWIPYQEFIQEALDLRDEP